MADNHKKAIAPIFDVYGRIRNIRISYWFDKLTFFRIFVFWVGIILLFGFYYAYFGNSNSYLLYSQIGRPVQNLMDSIYFSFITATSTGFGDITPIGHFKIISIVEVIFGLLLFAFVTSKLISIKQNVILSEIYEISFNERINRLRSSLLVFRQNLNRIIHRIDDGKIIKREIQDIYTNLSAFDDILDEILTLYTKRKNNDFTKIINPINTELLYNSVISSFEKIIEFIEICEERNLEWKKDITINLLEKCVLKNHELFDRIKSSKSIQPKNISDVGKQLDAIIEKIEKHIRSST